MTDQLPLSSFVQCTGCGRELASNTVTCPFCGTALAAAAAEAAETPVETPAETPAETPIEELAEVPPSLQVADPSLPIDWTRFALAGSVGLLVALLLGFVWNFIAVQVEQEFILAALVVGLIVGWSVAFVSECNAAIPYRALGAVLAGASIAFGEYLIYARPQSPFIFELDVTSVFVYIIALVEGWQGPRITARYRLFRAGLVNEGNQRPLLAGSVLVVSALIIAGFISGVLVGPKAVSAKMHGTRAATLLESGDFERATEELELALEDYEAFADAHLLLGMVQANNFELDTAGEHLNRALEIGMDGARYAEAHFQLGLIGWYRDENQSALDHLTKAVDSGYEGGAAHFIRGMILVNSEQTTAGTADLKRALELGLGPNDEAMATGILESIEAGE